MGSSSLKYKKKVVLFPHLCGVQIAICKCVHLSTYDSLNDEYTLHQVHENRIREISSISSIKWDASEKLPLGFCGAKIRHLCKFSRNVCEQVVRNSQNQRKNDRNLGEKLHEFGEILGWRHSNLAWNLNKYRESAPRSLEKAQKNPKIRLYTALIAITALHQSFLNPSTDGVMTTHVSDP